MKKAIRSKKKSATAKPSKRGMGWRPLVRTALRSLGGKAALADLYEALKAHPRAKKNRHFKAKIRQVVQLDPEIGRVSRGVWRIKPLRKGGVDQAS